jgi:cytochrome c peroxidase
MLMIRAMNLAGAVRSIAALCGIAAVACKGQGTAPEGSSGPSPSAPVSASAAKVPALPPVPETPRALGSMGTPKDNPTTPEKVRLGNLLFFDTRLSADGTRSCYSCHDNADGTGGHDPLAVGAKGVKLPRHAPVMWNVGYLPKLYWDGRSDSLEAQMKAAWAGGNMGVGQEGLGAKAKEIGELPEYKALFATAFPGEVVTPDIIARAVSAYERTLSCGDTAFDKFSTGDKAALTDEQAKGLALFSGKAACNACHTPPFFSDAYTLDGGAFHNVGIGTKGKPEADVDIGRGKLSKNIADWAAFKTPTLRNVTRSAPYFHDGSVSTLEEAVTLMASGGIANKHRDAKLVDKKLSKGEIASIVAFLGALECKGVLALPP